MPANDGNRDREKPEPRWSLLYALVAGELLALIVLFYAFTRAFS